MAHIVIVEDTVYKVSEKEYKQLYKKYQEIKTADWPKCTMLEDELNDYLDEAKLKYKNLGMVDFDFRR